MRYCPNCGHQLPEGAKFCHMCGSKLEESMMEEEEIKSICCPNCAAQLEYTGDLEHLHCRYCDTDILLNDEAARVHRSARAKCDARKLEMELDREQDRHNQKKELFQMILHNLPFFIVAFFLVIYTLGFLFRGELNMIMILWDALILRGVWKVTNREGKGRKNF